MSEAEWTRDADDRTASSHGMLHAHYPSTDDC